MDSRWGGIKSCKFMTINEKYNQRHESFPHFEHNTKGFIHFRLDIPLNL